MSANKFTGRWIGVLCFLLLPASAVQMHSSDHRRNRGQSSQPGVFDYYLFTLSWSPEFCYSHADKPECQSGHHGFVVHGLWPQFVNGYPENCSNESGLSDPSSVADIMPDPGLVAHEWNAIFLDDTGGDQAGVCAGEPALGSRRLDRKLRQ